MRRFLIAALLLCAFCAEGATAIPLRVIASPINLSVSISPTSGTAPLYVRATAAGTTASTTTLPWGDIEYSWDFGDANAVAAGTCGGTIVTGSGFFACGSNPGANSKNTMRGPVAGHVFERAGTYSTCLTSATDGTNTVGPQCVTITVTAADTTFATNTMCVANGSLPVAGSGGCPSGATVRQGTGDFDADMAAAVGASGCGASVTCKRVLFKGGDTFTASDTTTLSNVTGPFQVSSYGTGQAKVVPNGSLPSSGVFRPNGTTNDFRITNMEFDATGVTGAIFMTGANTPWKNMLVMHNYAHGWFQYMNNLSWGGSGGYGYYVVENRFESPDAADTTDMILPGNGSRIAVLGNYLSQGGVGQQVVRSNSNFDVLVSNNTISGAANTKATVDIRGNTEVKNIYGAVSDNSVSVGPADFGIYTQEGGGTSMGGYNTVIERNYVFGVSGGGATNLITTNAKKVTVRNNLLDGSNVDVLIAINLRDDNAFGSVPSTNVKVYNNTVFASRATGSLTAVTVSNTGTAQGTGNVVKNNLFAISGGLTGVGISDAGGIATKANNTCNTTGCTSGLTTDPTFTTSPPVVAADWKPTCTGSTYPCAQGTSVPVWSDFFGVAEPATRDIGAVNH